MSSRGRCGSSARVRSMPRSMCAVTHEDSTMSTAPEMLTLPQLMQAAQVAAQEVEKADSALATVKKASADAVAAATARDAAQADYLAACRVADPLLQELQVRSERISRVVGRST